MTTLVDSTTMTDLHLHSEVHDPPLKLRTRLEQIENKLGDFESGLSTHRGRVDGFGQELKILLAEINIITEWISDKFDVQLIDRQSFLFKHIHDYDEIATIAAEIAIPITPPKRRGRGRPKKKDILPTQERDNDSPERNVKKNNVKIEQEPYESDYGQEEDNFLESYDDLLNAPPAPHDLVETVFNDDEGSRPKRSTRRMVDYRAQLSEPKFIDEDQFESRKQKLRRRYRRRTPKVYSESEEGCEDGDDGEDDGDSKTVPRRGRPKKDPGEKIINWKNKIPLQCDECGKVLLGAGSLKAHKMIHSDTRPYKCEYCGVQFRRSQHMKYHIKCVHTKEKKLQCRFCGKLFHIPRDLSRHERTHTGERPWACEFCPKTFNIKDHLTMHIRVHTGERPYVCQICDKRFSQSNSLRIHKKIHSKIPGSKERKPRAPRGSLKATNKKAAQPDAPTPLLLPPHIDPNILGHPSETITTTHDKNSPGSRVPKKESSREVSSPNSTTTQAADLNAMSPPADYSICDLVRRQSSSSTENNTSTNSQNHHQLHHARGGPPSVDSSIDNSPLPSPHSHHHHHHSGHMYSHSQHSSTSSSPVPQPLGSGGPGPSGLPVIIPQFYDPNNIRYYGHGH